MKSRKNQRGALRATPAHKKIATRTEWRKYIFWEQYQFVGIFCTREISGYGVWYVRHLSEDDNAVEARNGKWLLGFFMPDAWNEALEFAVTTAGAEEDYRVAVRRLDQQAGCALRVRERQGLGPDYETKREFPKLFPKLD
ncbi:hypothetical protein [Paraburkholderia youngii]|uniref:hypothetical protein n=1 Tax=Paraburkholderia youngii TaxID=2782701 RepID=UPI003D1BA6BD